jgi:hypothetical protein
MNMFRTGWVVGCVLAAAWAMPCAAATLYVDLGSASPAPPYGTWATAAHTVQAAIGAASSGDEVVVAAGTYLLGSEVLIPAGKTLWLRSATSRGAILDGQGTWNCLRVAAEGTVVEGFAFRNGYSSGYGGGVSLNATAVLRDCLIENNRAWGAAGLMVNFNRSVVEDCTIVGNIADYWGGGVVLYNNATATVQRCTITDNVSSNYAGGVAYQGAGTVSECWIADNWAMVGDGGGVHMASGGGHLINTVLVGNRSESTGGGAYVSDGYFANCTVVANSAALQGGGVKAYDSEIWNTIAYYNGAPTGTNVALFSSTLNYSCVNPNVGATSITDEPGFVDLAGRNFRLLPASACIDAGSDAPPVGTDLDGNQRPLPGSPGALARYDMGAYEYAYGWDVGYVDLGGGWRRLGWFGDYVPMGNDGWIWHNKHGFFFVAQGSDQSSVWLYAQDMGWLWTGDTTYPFLYRQNDGAWLWYNGATGPRWFRNMATGAWESRP